MEMIYKALASALIGFVLGLFGAMLNADGTVCISMLAAVIGLLFLGFYTAPATSGGAYSGFPTQQISETVVGLDSNTRWRGKSWIEINLGLLVIIFAVSLSIAPLLYFVFLR